VGHAIQQGCHDAAFDGFANEFVRPYAGRKQAVDRNYERLPGSHMMMQTPFFRQVLILLFAILATGSVFALAYRAAEGELSFPPLFWWQLFTGNGAIAISGWVWSLRPGDLATRFFLISGVSTLVFTLAVAGFSIGGTLYSVPLRAGLLMINQAGAILFGIAMIGLFLVYPARLPHWKRWLAAAASIFSIWAILAFAGVLTHPGVIHRITLTEMILIMLVLVFQYFYSRHDPRARAILIWLGGAVAIGAGLFIVTVAAPNAFGYAALVDVRKAFGFFLIIYLGCAAGLLRYRLFDLGDWAFRALFYALLIVLIIALDTFIILVLPLDQGPALALSLLIVTLVYFPIRDTLLQRLFKRTNLSDQRLLQEVINTAFAPKDLRAGQWRQSLQSLFRPLEIRLVEPRSDLVAIGEEGLTLYLPELADSPALELRYLWNGQGLFGPSQARTAQHLVELMRRAEESRAAHERGVSEERIRIARDIHDNIGAQLMAALHSHEAGRKDVMIRESLSDLRNIINNAPANAELISDMLADLRGETAERMAASGIKLDWPAHPGTSAILMPEHSQALRSLIREAASNTIRHARASRFSFALTDEDAQIVIVLADDGTGFDAAQFNTGHGLPNMKSRARLLGGEIRFSTEGGTRIVVSIPKAVSRTGD